MNEKILLVDDEPKNVRILVEILEDDFQLETAYNCQEALEKADSFNPDIILMDIMMPDGLGTDVCKSLRAKEKFKNTIIMMVSGKSQVEDRLISYEAGANDFLVKPFVDDELYAKIKNFSKMIEVERGLIEKKHGTARLLEFNIYRN